MIDERLADQAIKAMGATVAVTDPPIEALLSRGRRSRRRATAAKAVGAVVLTAAAVIPIVISTDLGRHSQTIGSVTAPGALPAPCTLTHLSVQPLSPGTSPLHTKAQVLAAAAATEYFPPQTTSVTPVRMADPTAPDVGLGSGTQLRVMWVIDGTEVIEPDNDPNLFGPGYAIYPVGTVLRSFSLIDDATLKPAGRFDCGIVNDPSPRDTTPVPMSATLVPGERRYGSADILPPAADEVPEISAADALAVYRAGEGKGAMLTANMPSSTEFANFTDLSYGPITAKEVVTPTYVNQPSWVFTWRNAGDELDDPAASSPLPAGASGGCDYVLISNADTGVRMEIFQSCGTGSLKYSQPAPTP